MVKEGICLSYKCEILKGIHQSSHTYKMALYNERADLIPQKTTRYSPENEVISQGTNYSAGGQILTGFVVELVGEYATLNFDLPVKWKDSNISALAALIYNDSLLDKNAVAIIDFGKIVMSLNDDFSVDLDKELKIPKLIRII